MGREVCAMSRPIFKTVAVLLVPLALSGCLVGQVVHGSIIKGTEKRTRQALSEFDAGNYAAAARDCPAVYDEIDRKLDNTTGRYMDRVAARDAQKTLAMCAADANYMLDNRAAACRWYPRSDWQTASRRLDPRDYCGL